MRRKPFLLFASVLLLIGIIVLFTCIKSRDHFSLPPECEDLVVYIGMAKIDDQGQPFWTGTRGSAFRWDEVYMQEVADVLSSVKCIKANKAPTDVQLIQFSYRDKNREILWTAHVAYDFYEKKVYIGKKGTWYVSGKTDALDALIISELGTILKCRFNWCGQSNFEYEEFQAVDLNNLTFRYNLHWPPKEDSIREKTNLQTTDFNNMDAMIIENEEQAIKRAALELGYQSPIGLAYFDETCGFWMVEIYEDDGNNWDNRRPEFAIFLYENVKTVIMDNMGRTVEIYDDITSVFTFFEIVL